jgi:hypothetical protein
LQGRVGRLEHGQALRQRPLPLHRHGGVA